MAHTIDLQVQNRLRDHLFALCALDGVSGDEGAVRDYLRTQAQPFADQMETDVMGNLMVFRRGKNLTMQPQMLAAHMDEVGVMVNKITEEGMLKFAFVGGVDTRVAIGRTVRFGDGTVGVIGIKAVHLTTPAERAKTPAVKSLYIDIGATSKKEAEGKVSLGSCGAFVTVPADFGDGLFTAKAIDDRAGCAVLLELLREQPLVDTWFAFTVQEEVGLRGAATAAYRIQPNFCLIAEGTTAADLAGVPAHQQICKVRGGAVLPFMDGGTIYDEALCEMLQEAAEAQGIAWQTKHMVAGGTDAGRIHKVGEGVRCVGVAVPVRNIHTAVSVMAWADFYGVYALSHAFLQQMEGE